MEAGARIANQARQLSLVGGFSVVKDDRFDRHARGDHFTLPQDFPSVAIALMFSTAS